MPNEVLFFAALILFLFVGANASFWTATSAIRAVRERRLRLSELEHTFAFGGQSSASHATATSARAGSNTGALLRPRDVAILIAAHNEERGIERTVRSAAQHVPHANVFVASDGSRDATSAIARAQGANVVDIFPNRGKAGALEHAISWFRLADRFEVVVLLDADTVLAPDYLDYALPMFVDNEVVAVAGTARTSWDPGPSSQLGEFLITHRDRMYVVMQYLLKFGQAAKFANAVMIVPGFASLYRTRILADVDISAPGLVIEDYNMTFEVHAKRLGRIAFDPRIATAYTQDPDTVDGYIKQVRRWNLGFWQTLRRHRGMEPRFRALVSFSVVELFLSALFISAMPLLAVGLHVVGLQAVVAPAPIEDLAARFPGFLVLLAFFLSDFLATVLSAIIGRRGTYLKWAPLLPALRWLDAVLCIQAALLSFKRGSDGRWRSPARR